MIEKLKTSKESNDSKQTTGEKIAEIRNKINEIIDSLNKDSEYSNYVNEFLENITK